MKKLTVILVVISLLILVGCIPSYEPNGLDLPDNYEVPETNGTDIPIAATPTPASNVVLPGEPPSNITWMSPGKVLIGNFYPGARAEYPVTIHNGNDWEASFNVTYRYPDHVGEGYTKPSIETQDWVIIADPTPILVSGETRNILVVLAMPEGATSPSSKWEFWVSVVDTTQEGSVTTELCCRWIVDMRPS